MSPIWLSHNLSLHSYINHLHIYNNYKGFFFWMKDDFNKKTKKLQEGQDSDRLHYNHPQKRLTHP